MDSLIPCAQSLFSLQTFQVRTGKTLEVCSYNLSVQIISVAQIKSSCTMQSI